jgi:protein-tyrosine sulfotransferase
VSTTTDPIFIAGFHRSGTTLLRFMLNCNPRIYIPPESDFISRFVLGRAHKELSDARITHLLDVIFGRYRFVREWQGDPLDPAASAACLPARTPAASLDTRYTDYAQQHGADRWGGKELHIDIYFTARIEKAFLL